MNNIKDTNQMLLLKVTLKVSEVSEAENIYLIIICLNMNTTDDINTFIIILFLNDQYTLHYYTSKYENKDERFIYNIYNDENFSNISYENSPNFTVSGIEYNVY